MKTIDCAGQGMTSTEVFEAAIAACPEGTPLCGTDCVVECDDAVDLTLQMILDARAAIVADAPKKAIRAQLARSDAGMVRVLEDLVATLVAKGTIALADLPAAAKKKLDDRAALRAQL